MYKLFLFFIGSFIYMEGIYHTHVYGFSLVNPILLIPIAVFWSVIEAMLVRISKKRKVNLAVMWICMWINYLIHAVQLVYHNIFQQPLLIEIALATGGEAITDFWGMALEGILRSIFPLILLAVPFFVAAFLLHKDWLKLKKYHYYSYIQGVSIAVAALALFAMVLSWHYIKKDDFYINYQEMYAPDEVAKNCGILSMFQRDLMGGILPEVEAEIPPIVVPPIGEDTETGSETGSTEDPGPQIDRSPQVFDIDFDALLKACNKDQQKLVGYLQQMTPSNKNEYTGMFAGYNLIYITAEAFSPYCVSEELTPTLWKLSHSGIVVDDFYVPLGSTSTSDGEYMNLLGQFPAGSHNFRNSKDNTYPYSLPAYFAKEGVKSYAYHSNSLSYYDRYLTHPNLGYDFKAAKLGSCSSSYKDKLFSMQGASSWPNSDYELFVATIPEFINEERFHTYYMTMSGHAGYSWKGNAMSAKNKELVANLDCSEPMKAYIACNLELEKAMTYLIEQLELAGKLDNTVIVLSADHYPYGLAEDSTGKDAKTLIGEFLGKEISTLDVQKNTLIMWNSQMETITVDKTCSSIDIIPTILNLFGFDFDSRLFVGRDMLSDSPSLVMFLNKSFITDYVSYNTSGKETIYRTDVQLDDAYLSSMKSYVSLLFKYSKGMLDEDFHNIVSKYVRTEGGN